MNATGIIENAVQLDGQKNPIHLNSFILVVHYICCLLGIPPNAFIACFILSKRYLRRKARNIFLLGLVLCNLSAFVPFFIELAYIRFPSNAKLGQICVVVVGLPFTLYLSNLLLALADRYIALAHPLWHRNKVTVRWAALWQIFVSLSMTLVYSFVYITGLVELECEGNLVQVGALSIILLVLFSACIIAQIIVYRQTKSILSSYVPTTSLRRGTSTQPQQTPRIEILLIEGVVEIDSANRGNAQQQNRLLADGISAPNETFSASVHLQVHMSEQTVSKLDIEATQTLIAGVSSLTFLSGPFILFSLTTFICHLFPDQFECSSISWLSPYFELLLVLYAVYHPIMLLFRKIEISSEIKDWIMTQ